MAPPGKPGNDWPEARAVTKAAAMVCGLNKTGLWRGVIYRIDYDTGFLKAQQSPWGDRRFPGNR